MSKLVHRVNQSFDQGSSILLTRKTVQGIHTDRDTGHPTLKKGKLNLVDLAGSERHGKTGEAQFRNIPWELRNFL